MKKFLCVLAAAMCGATLMLSACGGSGGDDSSEEVELTEVTAMEAYEMLSVFNEKVQTAVASDSFNMIFNTDGMSTVQYSSGEESKEYTSDYDLDSEGLYDGEHFYGYVAHKSIDTDYYTYRTYCDMQMELTRDENLLSKGDEAEFERADTYESIDESINSFYYGYDGLSDLFLYFMKILQLSQSSDEIVAGYEDIDFQLTIKMYSEADYIKIAIASTLSEEGYTSSSEYNLEINLAAGLTADDFESLSYESNSSELNPGSNLPLED